MVFVGWKIFKTKKKKVEETIEVCGRRMTLSRVTCPKTFLWQMCSLLMRLSPIETDVNCYKHITASFLLY